MTVEITSRDTMDPTTVDADFATFVNELNLAHAAGKQFIIFTEVLPDGRKAPVALSSSNMTRVREELDTNAFVG